MLRKEHRPQENGFRMFQGNSRISEGRLVGSAFPFHGLNTGHFSTIKWRREYNLAKFYFVYGFKHVSNIISIYLILPWMKHNAWRDQIIFCTDQNGACSTDRMVRVMVIVWPERGAPSNFSQYKHWIIEGGMLKHPKRGWLRKSAHLFLFQGG